MLHDTDTREQERRALLTENKKFIHQLHNVRCRLIGDMLYMLIGPINRPNPLTGPSLLSTIIKTYLDKISRSESRNVVSIKYGTQIK